MSCIVPLKDCPLGSWVEIFANVGGTADYGFIYGATDYKKERVRVVGKNADEAILGLSAQTSIRAWRSMQRCVEGFPGDWKILPNCDFPFYWLTGIGRRVLLLGNPQHKCSLCQIPMPHLLEEVKVCRSCQVLVELEQ